MIPSVTDAPHGDMKVFLDLSRSVSEAGNRVLPIIDQTPLPVVEVRGPTHRIAHVNAAFCQLLGRSREALVGRSFAEIAPGASECVPVLDRIRQTPAAASPEEGAEAAVPRTHWLFAMWPAPEARERTMGVIIQMEEGAGFSRDAAAVNEALLIAGLRQHELTAEAVKLNGELEKEIAERKLVEARLHVANERLAGQAAQLDQLVGQRTRRLQETVSELEAFSYSVAHDMRAPLRAMQGFAQILLDEHSGQLVPPAREYLQRIASSASRLDLIIRDVLNYAKVLRGEVQLAPVDLDRLVRDIIALYPGWQPPKAEILIDGVLPRVMGHEGFLTQCVSNLLGNATKFVAAGITPRVRIWTQSAPPAPTSRPDAAGDEPASADGEASVRVWFEDNGIGIAAKDHSRVFRMLERINPTDHDEGTGIGLTIVRKAIERMGGRVGFESELGQGSRFWIELRQAAAP